MVQVEKVDKKKKILCGRVISDKMDKTVVIEVERTFKHPTLHKVLRKMKKYKVHDEQSLAKVGDVVEIVEGRPVSKTKFMYLFRVVSTQAS